jgi:hypothetical protein
MYRISRNESLRHTWNVLYSERGCLNIFPAVKIIKYDEITKQSKIEISRDVMQVGHFRVQIQDVEFNS